MRRTVLLSAVIALMVLTATSTAAAGPAFGGFELRAKGVGATNIPSLAYATLEMEGDFFATCVGDELDVLTLDADSGSLRIYYLPGGLAYDFDLSAAVLGWSNVASDELSGEWIWKIKDEETDYVLKFTIVWNRGYSRGIICGRFRGTFVMPKGETLYLIGSIRGRVWV